jgi:hypothetical protein
VKLRRIVGIAVLDVIEVTKSTFPWSHLPEAWNKMLIASAIRLEQWTLPRLPAPPAPQVSYQHPLPVPSKPDIRAVIVNPTAVSLLWRGLSPVIVRNPK